MNQTPNQLRQMVNILVAVAQGLERSDPGRIAQRQITPAERANDDLKPAVLVEDDPLFYNIYHVMPVNAAKFRRVNARAGQAFADWILSPEGQAVIGEVGKAEYGRSLFVPGAGMRRRVAL